MTGSDITEILLDGSNGNNPVSISIIDGECVIYDEVTHDSITLSPEQAKKLAVFYW